MREGCGTVALKALTLARRWGSRLPTQLFVRVAVIALVVVLVLALSARALLSRPLGDFTTYYSAALTVRDGGELYRAGLMWRDGGWTVLLPGAPPDAYVYPPLLALVLVPLTLLQLDAAKALWLILLVSSLVVTARVLARLVLPSPLDRSATGAAILTALLALFGPVRLGVFIVGQVDVILLAFLVLSLSAFSSRRDVRAAFWLGLAAAIKPTVGFLALFFLWKRSYGLAALAAAWSLVLIIGPTLLLGVGPLRDFVTVARYWSSPSFAVTPVNQSPYGLALRLFTANPFTSPIIDLPVLATLTYVAAVAVALAVLVATISRSRALPPHHLGLEFGLATLGMLFVSPLSENNHYVYALISLVAVGAALAQPALPHRKAVALAVILAVLFAYFSLPVSAIEDVLSRLRSAPVQGVDVDLTNWWLLGLVIAAALAVVTLRTRPQSVARRRSGPGLAVSEDPGVGSPPRPPLVS